MDSSELIAFLFIFGRVDARKPDELYAFHTQKPDELLCKYTQKPDELQN